MIFKFYYNIIILISDNKKIVDYINIKIIAWL